MQNEEALSKHRTKKNKEKNNKIASLNATVGTVTSGFLPSRSTSGVLYIGHIPHGFYEDQMRGSRFPLPTNLSCMGECLCLLACNCFLLLLRPKVFVQPHCFVLLWQGFLANLEQLSAFDYLEIRRWKNSQCFFWKKIIALRLNLPSFTGLTVFSFFSCCFETLCPYI